MNAWARRIAREPLLHFLLAGGLLFGADRLVRGDGQKHEIVVSAVVKKTLEEDFTRGQGRPPTEAELTKEIDRWVDEEMMYRSGLERGLDRDDPMVRQRVVAKVSQAMRDGTLAVTPSDDELRAYFESHRDRYARAEQIDFTQVFVEGRDEAAKKRAEELLSALTGGADPAGMGDTFSGGRRYRKRKIEDLATTFGKEFVAGLDTQPAETWELRPSTFGYHLVRVDKRSEASAPPFEEVRAEVEKDMQDEGRAAQVAKGLEELRSHWTVVR